MFDRNDPSSPLRIGIVAGETSGDAIAADLIHVLKKRYPNATFEGIAGPKMQSAGCVAMYDSERLAVMAITEVLHRLRELLKIRKTVANHFISNPPDVFIGVDAPDFNLALERKLKQHNIPVVHYVSPSVWAWRQYRVKKIAKSIDLMLTLLPFEYAFYVKHKIPAKFVGHPMADQIPFKNAKSEARDRLEISSENKLVALLPGSRFSEVERLLPLMLDAADFCFSKNNTLEFLIPAATSALFNHIDNLLSQRQTTLPVKLIEGNARDVMQASDLILLASGTATLEAMLLNRPMVVTYKVSSLSYWIMKRLSNVKHVSLPNFFSEAKPVPEFLQDDATKEKIGDAMMHLLNDESARQKMCENFHENHVALKKNASEQAADAILALISRAGT